MRTVRGMTACLLLTVLAGCTPRKETTAAAENVTPVRVVPAAPAAVSSHVRAVGVLTPRDEIRLAFKNGGVIERISVDIGDSVRRGQVLATLKREEVDAAVTQAAEGVQKARRDLERARRLRADEVATEEQVQDLTTAYNVARSGLEALQFNARFARIEAPTDGVVFERLAEPAELVQGGQPVLVLGATGRGWIVRAALADRDVVRVKRDTSAQVAFDAFPGRSFNGRVSRIAAAADPHTGTFDVEIEIQPDGSRFVRGLVAKVKLGLEATPLDASAGLLVPLSALVAADGQDGTVYVLDSGGKVARRKSVTVGSMVGEQVVIQTGLVAGEQVITEGAAWLTDGGAVRVVDGRG